MVFDRMKTELGNKEFKRLIRQKVKPMAMDLVRFKLLVLTVLNNRVKKILD